MKNKLIFLFAFLAVLPSCKSKKKDFIPVLSLLKSQVAHVETSFYSIKKIVITDSLHNDTIDIPREEFRAAAKDFLTLPDLSDKKVAGSYKQETLFDETINRLVITYTPENPVKEIIQKQELLVTPGTADGDNVNDILINTLISNRDSSVQKNMLWQMDKSFQVATILQKPGMPEKITVLKITWNEDHDQ